MDHVNWWLIGLAFVFGLVLTLVLTIRRVKREVPVNSSTAAAAGAAEPETAKIETAKMRTPDETATTKIPAVEDEPTTKIPAADAGAAESKNETSESGKE
jgi:hypothetical protein